MQSLSEKGQNFYSERAIFYIKRYIDVVCLIFSTNFTPMKLKVVSASQKLIP